MTIKLLKRILCLLLVSLSLTVVAKNLSNKEIQSKLSDLFGGISPNKIQLVDKGITGFLIVQAEGQYGIISKNGKYFFQGDAWDIQKKLNLTKQTRSEHNLKLVKDIAKDRAIEFESANEKASIWVYTDVDCYYCRKLHSEVPQLNKLGVSVKYLAYPRSGNPQSEDWKKSTYVWCAKNQLKAMTIAKKGQNVFSLKQKSNCNPEILEQFNSGRMLGVNGTPAILMPDGSLVPGYIPAEQLAESLIQ